jgi:hypothetical protein
MGFLGGWVSFRGGIWSWGVRTSDDFETLGSGGEWRGYIGGLRGGGGSEVYALHEMVMVRGHLNVCLGCSTRALFC